MKDIVKSKQTDDSPSAGSLSKLNQEGAYINRTFWCKEVDTFIRLLYREVKHDKGGLKVADFDLDKIKNAIFLCCDAMGVVFKIINCFKENRL